MENSHRVAASEIEENEIGNEFTENVPPNEGTTQ